MKSSRIDHRVTGSVVRLWIAIALASICSGLVSAGQLATANVHVSEVAPHVYVLSEPTANAVVVTDDDGALFAGVQRPSLVVEAKALVQRTGSGRMRYALMMEDEQAPQFGDGGWGRASAVTMTHERLYRRMLRPAQPRMATNDLPATSFSAVVQIRLKNEEVHFIHERFGYTDADTIVHVENTGALYLGNTFTTDGYPTVLLDRGGTISGLIGAAEYFIRAFGNDPGRIEPIIPGRGPIGTMSDLREYSNMLIAISYRIGDMAKKGLTLQETLALKPTAEFDARWGHGPVSPDEFTTVVSESLKRDARKTTAIQPTAHDHAELMPRGGK